VPAAVALRVKATGEQIVETISQLDATTNRLVPSPIDLGPEGEQVFLILFGSGFRNRQAGGSVTVQVGGENAEVTYAGAQGDLVGVDQLNLKLPRTLIGKGDIQLVLTVDGKSANSLRIKVK